MPRKVTRSRGRTARVGKPAPRHGTSRLGLRFWMLIGLVPLVLGFGGLIYLQTAGARAALTANGVLTFHRGANIYTLSLDSKTERKLTDYPPESAAQYSARAPDGTRLAVVTSDQRGQTLSVLDPNSGSSRAVAQEPSPYLYLTRPQWTPDARGILYTVHEYVMDGTSIKDETFRAEQVDAESGDRRVVATDAQDATLARDGTLVFVRHSSAVDELILRTPDGTEQLLVPRGRFLSLAAPRISPDGQRIAFVAVDGGPLRGQRPSGLGALLEPATAYAHGLPWDIWLVDRRGEVKLVNKLAEDDPTVAWSPDGQYLAVSGENGVYAIELTGGRVSRLTRVGGSGGIDWTP